MDKEEIRIKHKLMKKHIPYEIKMLSEKKSNVLKKIDNIIAYAYNDSMFFNSDETLIMHMYDGNLKVMNDDYIIYQFDKDNPCVKPLIKFLLKRGYYGGQYVCLHGFKYMYRLLNVLDELNELENNIK